MPLLFALNILLRAQDLTLPAAARATQTSPSNRTAGPHFTTGFAPSPASLASASQLPKFVAHREYAAADGPQNMAMGDLNGDGIPDLVLPNGNTSNVSVLLGNRNGTFQPFVLFNAGGFFPFHVVIADFNGDGHNDVAVTHFSGLSILLGDGKGNLGSPTVLATGSVATRIAAADFNGDHKIDLAVTNLGSNDVSILLGHGDGTFAPAVNIAVGMGPAGIAAGDFNGDGKVDLAVANSGTASGNNQGPNPNTVQVLIGDGKGGFTSGSVIPVEKTPLVVLVSDFNKDNVQDLAVSSSAKGFVSSLLGKGDGTFQTPREFKVGPSANNMSAADLNGDGNLDIAVTTTNGLQTLTNIVTLFGDGKGAFHAVSTPSGRSPFAVVAGDFNHDGKTDYITANIDSNTVAVVLGKGNGTFLDIGPGITGGSRFAGETIAADFNNDGILDLALANTGVIGEIGQSVIVFLGKKNGTFGAAQNFSVGSQPDGLVAADLNHDGILDLIVADFGNLGSNIDVAVLLGNGDGTFQTSRRFGPGPGFPFKVAVADFNGDGNLDVVVAQGGFSGAVSLLLGDGKGNLGSPQLITSSADRESEVIAADVNHDGKADIVYFDLDAGQVLVQLGNGNGTFQPATVVVSLGIFGTGFTTGDFNNDGVLDVAAEASGVVDVLLGDGTGRFNLVNILSEGTESGFAFVPTLLVGDFNGDGFQDIAAPDGFGETASILPGNGDGTFGTATLFQGGFTDSAVVLNLPGFQPSIAMATEDFAVRILRNQTPSK